MLITFGLEGWLIGIGLLFLILPLLWLRKSKASFLIFFSLFWAYLLIVVQNVAFPFVINTSQNGSSFTPSLNLIPFNFGSCGQMPVLCVRSIFSNIFLTVPFGFGISFLIKIRARSFVWLSIIIGFGFEALQLAISFLFTSAFRAVDINDAILNAFGVLLGYALFRGFAWVFLKTVGLIQIKSNWLFADIYAVASRANNSRGFFKE